MTHLDFTTRIVCPYVQVPKILRFLSFICPKTGKPMRYNQHHIAFIVYCSECEEHYKSLETAARELGWSKPTVVKIRNELALPAVELGVPIIVCSKFTDLQNEPRTQIEVCPYQEKMGAYFDQLYDKENGCSFRDRWLCQWEKEGSKVRLQGGSKRRLPRVVKDVYSNNPNCKENKKNNTGAAACSAGVAGVATHKEEVQEVIKSLTSVTCPNGEHFSIKSAKALVNECGTVATKKAMKELASYDEQKASTIKGWWGLLVSRARCLANISGG